MQKKSKSLKLNFIMNSILTMSSFIFPLISFPYVSRILSPDGIGKVSFATSVISYFSMFAQLGIPTYGVRACAKIRDDKDLLSKTVQEIFIINAFMSVIIYVFLFLSILFVPRLQEDKSLLLIISLTILFNLIGVEWLYKALEEYKYIAMRSIIFKFIALLFMFMLIHEKNDYLIYGAISIFASSASSVLNFINLSKFITIKRFTQLNFKRHLKAVAIFFAMSCATTVYTHLDVVMLGFLKTDSEVGFYNAAVKIKSILVSIVTSLGVVLLPRASYYVEKGLHDEFYQITKKAIHFVILISLPLMIYFILFAKEGILLLSGGEFEPAVLPMQIIMPTLLLIGLTNVMGIQVLVPIGKEKIVLYSEIGGAIVNVFINWMLIPQYGAIGAAIGTLIAELVVWIVQFLALKGTILKAYTAIRYWKIIIGIICGTILSLFIKQMNLGILLLLVISAVLFFGGYFIVLLLCRESLIVELLNKMYFDLQQKTNLIKNNKNY